MLPERLGMGRGAGINQQARELAETNERVDFLVMRDEVKGSLPKMPTLTKAPRSALKGQNSNPMGMGLLQGFGAGSSMQVTK